MLVTELICWLFSLWFFHVVIFPCIKSVAYIQNPSPASQSCRQNIKSPTSVTNIDVTTRPEYGHQTLVRPWKVKVRHNKSRFPFGSPHVIGSTATVYFSLKSDFLLFSNKYLVLMWMFFAIDSCLNMEYFWYDPHCSVSTLNLSCHNCHKSHDFVVYKCSKFIYGHLTDEKRLLALSTFKWSNYPRVDPKWLCRTGPTFWL